jgi:hypothetical protein
MPKKKRGKPPPLPMAEIGQKDGPPDLQTLPSGERIHLVPSGQTIMSCMYHPDRLREAIAGWVFDYIEMVRTGESFDYSSLGTAEERKGKKIAIQYRDPVLHEEFSKYANLAYEYFAGAIQQKLHELPQQLFIEVMNAVVIRMKRDDFISLKGKSAATEIWNEYFDRLKARIKSQWDAPKRGPEAEWTPERRAEVLDYYNAALRALQSARDIYKKKGRLAGWREAITAKHPELGDDLIGRLVDKRPSDLALELTGKHFDLIREWDRGGEDQLKKELTRARGERGTKRKRKSKAPEPGGS